MSRSPLVPTHAPLGPPPGSVFEEKLAKEAQARTEPVMVRCSGCEHAWPCAYLPMPLTTAAALMKDARCPKGCSRPIHLANMPVASS